jgi:hypothetical protein
VGANKKTDPDLQAFLSVAETAAHSLPHSIAGAGNIALEAITLIQQIRRRGKLPDQLDVFQRRIDRVAWCA